ncbi:class I SAM-dependent methyltransferase [Streptomyces sp. NPDC050610]|uniref:class I SAM-dependent methyltransferase n=1 Tax=Streptomyces sp. NPDC050610 TaxID=3157097 RepID=UPI0034461F2B
MSVSDRYRDAWESYWSDVSDAPGEAMWDAEPEFSAVPHLALLEPHTDRSRPIVDLGCGSGTQTRHLATRYARAVGVDLSHAAVEHARRADPSRTAEFEQLNLVDAAAVRALHERLGDADVYMRAVIHQSDPQDRAPVAAAVAALIGRDGRAFVTELTKASRTVISEVAQAPGGPPPKLEAVLSHGLRPAEAEDREVADLLEGAGLEILAQGGTTLPQTEFRRDGTRIELPAEWFVVRGRE